MIYLIKMVSRFDENASENWRLYDDETVSTREAAAILGVCVRTVQLWVESGRLQAWKTPGGHRRISRKSVEKELRSRVSKRAEPVADFDVLIVEDERIQRKGVSK